jgi:carbamoyltransferase
MIVLGVHDSNLSSACLLLDGKIVAAVAEERLNRRKGTGRFPRLSIRKVLELAGVPGTEVDVVALGMMSSAFDTERAQKSEYRWEAKLAGLLSEALPLDLLSGEWLSRAYVRAMSPVRRWRLISEQHAFFSEIGIAPSKFRFYDHHACHAAVAYYNRPWDRGAAVFTCDGEGDGYSATVWIGEAHQLRRVGTVTPAHSLGSMYSRITRSLGMTPWRDEHKVMGLAGYRDRHSATPTVRRMADWAECRDLGFRNRTGRVGEAFYRWALKQLAGARFDEVALGMQRLLEDTLCGWVARNLRQYAEDHVALGGGVFLNVKANKRLAELPQVKDLFVFPAAADDCASLGAAILGYRELCCERGREFRYDPLRTPYLGPVALDSVGDLERVLRASPYNVSVPGNVAGDIAALLAGGEIVARCSGRLELGPRALGNRSILAHPGRVELVGRLNRTVKRRDFWMPFAPTILADQEWRYLSNPKRLRAPHMILAFDTLPPARREIPAALHQGDHTTRPQVLREEDNTPFHQVLCEFHRATGVGAVLNTSLNLHGEPIVCDWRDALDTFERSELRHLVIENYLISKNTD